MVTVSQTFLVLDDLDSFEEYRLGVVFFFRMFFSLSLSDVFFFFYF